MKFIIIFLFFLFSHAHLIAQTNSKDLTIRERDSLLNTAGQNMNKVPPNYPLAIQQLSLMKEKAISIGDEENVAWADIYIAYCFSNLHQYEKLKTTLDKLTINDRTVLENNQEVLIDYYFLLGSYYFNKKREYGKALNYYRKVKSLLDKKVEGSFYENDLYNNLGLLYKKFGDYSGALDAYQSFKTNDALTEAVRHFNITKVYFELDEFTEALENLHKMDAVLSEVPFHRTNKHLHINLYRGYGYCYTQLAQIEKAKYYLSQAEKLKPDPQKQFKILRSYALINLQTKELDKATNYLEQAIFLHRKEDLANSWLSEIYIIYGNIYRQKKQFSEALFYYQKALVISGKDFNEEKNITKNPQSAKIALDIDLLNALEIKAEVLTENRQSEIALDTYQSAINLLDTIRINNISNASSKYYWLSKSKPIYEKAIILAVQLGKDELAYQIGQKSHAAFLWELLKDVEGKKLGNVPDNLIAEEKDLKIRISAKELQLQGKTNTSEKVVLLELKHQLYDLQKKLEQDYPIYYQTKYILPTIPLKDIQSQLDAKTALIEYFMGEEDSYAFVVTTDNLQVIPIEKTEELIPQIEQLRKSTKSYNPSKTNYNRFTDSAYYLYKKLFAPIRQELRNIEHLVIIPDEQLGYINLGTLIEYESTKELEYDKLKYLINKYSFSYNYSSALFFELNQVERKEIKPNTILGFAPVFPGNPTLTRNGDILDSLRFNINEIDSINLIIEGKTYSGNEATLNAFLSTIETAKIIHLSTHAVCNDSFPLKSSIHFSDTSLTAYEIHELPFNFEMAVLSICEASKGLLNKGEGIISLSRAFIQAGCPSIISSLWQVNDEKSIRVIQPFYENIAEGQAKHIALSSAQREYLENCKKRSDAHPHFWGTFIQIGNTAPISTFASKSFFPGWSGWFLVVPVLLFLFWKQKNTNS